MRLSRRSFLNIGGLTLGASLLDWKTAPSHAHQIDKNLHLLNRITWGPQPEEIRRLSEIGYAAFVEEQLHPETIDDSDLALQHMPLLEMDRFTLHRLQDGPSRAYRAMIEGMITRAVFSKRQLLERLVDFWTDHFNVVIDNGAPDMLVYQRDAIRNHALGQFHNMLLATAKHPAMLFYLDNFLNVGEHPNENYARELLELHTLGVDGGYTEADVHAVARAFTGWTIHDATPDGFYFDPGLHDFNAKQVLGHTLAAERGIEDGLQVIGILASHPATAQFICRKLCVRFVSDEPPQSLVNSAAQIWQVTHGNIRDVMRHILMSPEFAAATRKLRRPLEFFVGALRATGTRIRSFWQLHEMLQELGQLPFGWHPPNGYPDVADAWLTSNGLLARWNVAMRLTLDAYNDPYTDLSTELHERIGQPQTVDELVDAVASRIFGTPLSEGERQPFVDYTSDFYGGNHPVTPALLAQKLATLYALMLASPNYQWR